MYLNVVCRVPFCTSSSFRVFSRRLTYRPNNGSAANTQHFRIFFKTNLSVTCLLLAFKTTQSSVDEVNVTHDVFADDFGSKNFTGGPKSTVLNGSGPEY